jgi:hypothetical protein
MSKFELKKEMGTVLIKHKSSKKKNQLSGNLLNVKACILSNFPVIISSA